MSEQKMTVATLNVKLNDEVSALRELVSEMSKHIEQLEVSNLQMRTELLELRATSKPASKSAKPEAKYTDGVLTFLPQGVTDIVGVSPDDHPYRALKDSTGAQHRCDGRVWAFWKTLLERRQKAAAQVDCA